MEENFISFHKSFFEHNIGISYQHMFQIHRNQWDKYRYNIIGVCDQLRLCCHYILLLGKSKADNLRFHWHIFCDLLRGTCFNRRKPKWEIFTRKQRLKFNVCIFGSWSRNHMWSPFCIQHIFIVINYQVRIGSWSSSVW